MFKDYKPLSEKFFGVLDVDWVGKWIFEAIVKNEAEVFIPWIIQVISVGVQALPYWMWDWVEIAFGGRGMKGVYKDKSE